MSITTDKSRFFQSSDALHADTRRARKAANTRGAPIPVGSKILALLDDPTSPDHVFVAESAGLARRLQLSSGSKGSHTYRGHTAPVTALALSPAADTLYTSSWDKSILAFDVPTRSLLRRFQDAHTDFIKCLLYLPPLPPATAAATAAATADSPGLLLSGSSDSTISIYNPHTTKLLSKLSSHSRAVLCLALDPAPPLAAPTPSYTVLSGSSDREIRTWTVPASGSLPPSEASPPLTPHETSIYCMHLPPSDPGHLYTASADRTALHLQLNPPPNPPSVVDTLPHPDFVTAIILAGFSSDDADADAKYIVTACRDEHVRLWDRATAELVCVFEGHFDEVTSLCAVGARGWTVVSAGIDGTVRRWGVRPAEVEAVVALEKDARRAGSGEQELQEDFGGGKKQGMLTQEEERELAELMESSD
ncbi:WD40 repeat-like protein [Terfezia boudieri ATCC MYA-4762]|uniref:WD40 repeat-like protein n=1 Tax=Terfezia boudieri ATCC MYA-4762 TaxID=1051890 RepID=A0A3N4LTN0_9PEZI|nr:WD40 repeat-like protein [Terfezia boudieri ATCC MYA-4762]